MPTLRVSAHPLLPDAGDGDAGRAFRLPFRPSGPGAVLVSCRILAVGAAVSVPARAGASS